MARAEATLGLRAGYAVLASESLDGGNAGWWHVGIVDGEMVGWIPGAHTALNGRVDMGAAALGKTEHHRVVAPLELGGRRIGARIVQTADEHHTCSDAERNEEGPSMQKERAQHILEQFARVAE